jgi:hypothetical protein
LQTFPICFLLLVSVLLFSIEVWIVMFF